MKRKGTTLLVSFLCLLILLLIALGVFMTWLMNEQTRTLESRFRHVQAEQKETTELGTYTYIEDSPSKKDSVLSASEHHFIFVGDSRTVGMEEAVHAEDSADACTFIGKVGEGLYWLSQEGIRQLDDALSKTPESIVIFNLGVNDLKEIQNYLDYYSRIFSDYPETSFYLMSVNPVSEDFTEISNEEIRSFNEKLCAAFPTQYLDCYNYLISEGFQTADGLHYDYETYRSIHHYAVMMFSASES